MRKIEYCESGFYGREGSLEPKGFKQGVFHKFAVEGSESEGLECYAVVEIEDGTVRTVSTARIKFLDKPIVNKCTDCAVESLCVKECEK